MKTFHEYAMQPLSGAILGLMLLIGSGPSSAQSSEQDLDLEEVIVTATRVEKDQAKIPAAISVLSKDDIQRGRQQLGLDEALANIPGLFMQNRFNFAQDLRISIRGFGARASFGIRGIKILVDGIPETLADGQGQVDSIDLGSTQQIEVIRGPASALYGNASGGVINITSELGASEPYLDTRVSFGEFGFRKFQLKAGGSNGPFDYLVNVSDMELDGYRDHSETENTQLNSKFRYRIDESSNLSVVFNATDQPLANDPGGIDAASVATDPRQARAQNVNFAGGEELEQQRLGAIYNKSFGEHHAISLRNYYVWRDFANKLPFTGGGAVDLERFFVGGGGQYTYSNSLAGRPNRFIVGVDIDNQDDDRKRFDNNLGILGPLTLDQNEKVTSLGVFAQNEFTLRDDLELTLGARYDRVKFDVGDRFLSDGNDSGARTLTETSPMAGLVFSPTGTINLYTTVATSFETPTTTEFANPNGGGGFNPNIDPQKATNYEVGIKGTFSGRHRYDIALFKIDVEDELIPFEIPTNPGRDFFQNAGETDREGLEVRLMLQPTDRLRTSFAYTYSDFTFDRFSDDNGNDFAGNTVPGTPENIFHAELAYSHPSGFFGIFDLLYVDELLTNNANTVIVDAYSVANLRLGYEKHFGSWKFSPFLGVNNLLDEEYNSNIRINAFGGRYFEPAPDQNLYAGFSLAYDFGG